MIRISAIVPVYNTKEEYLKQCFSSIHNQIYKPIETIFVNDGSTREETLRFLDSIRNIENVKVIDQENKKTAAALNAGIREMKGDWWAGLSSDDQWKPYKLKFQARCIEQVPEAKVIYGDYELIDQNNNFIRKQVEPEFNSLQQQQKFLVASYFGMWSNLLIAREVLDEINGFNNEFICCEDYEFAIRLSVKYKYYKIPEVLSSYRIHQEQNTNTVYGYQGKIGGTYDKRCHELAKKLFG
jgi:glycosyltransferase involved in cell wall biosynthesis